MIACEKAATPAEDGANLADAGGTDAKEPVTPESLVGRGFDVELVGNDVCFLTCAPNTLFVADATDSSLSIVWGLPGRALTGVLEQNGASWKLVDSLELERLSQGWDNCASHNDLTNAVFDFADHDDDGVVDLEGTADRTRTQCSDDTPSSTFTQPVEFTGQPDVTLPFATAAGAGGLWNASVTMSEPLRPAATATFEGPAGTVPLLPTLVSGYVLGFSSDVILPFGVELELGINGLDLAGVGSPAPLVVKTPDDFGVLIPDGFETGSTSGVRGDAEIVETFQGEPAMTGQKMIFIPPGPPILFHLQRVGSETTISMQTRVVSYCYQMAGSVAFTAGVVGGTQRTSASITQAELTPLPPDTGAQAIGTQQTTVVPIPELGKDVLLDVVGSAYQGAGCAMLGVLIDDLHLE